MSPCVGGAGGRFRPSPRIAHALWRAREAVICASPQSLILFRGGSLEPGALYPCLILHARLSLVEHPAHANRLLTYNTMRLLHTSELGFREFFEENVPRYAILSHRWGSLDEEVSYEDFMLRNKTGAPGYRKIVDFCAWAATKGFTWVWIDTCCIDKRSSAEVSEAINSMFSWYGRCSQCVVYLADIRRERDLFTSSDWFTRGWTLQELLAPLNLLFVSKHWQVIGGKQDPKIAVQVAKRTGIPVRVLREPGIVHSVSVARRMSWAAGRRTTKSEDMAYALLGIFDVNMPLLYGEGQKAFQRLQLQIMEQCDDESIFAWQEQLSKVAKTAYRGLLARSASQFADCGRVVVLKPSSERRTHSVRVNARTVDFYTSLLEAAYRVGGEPVYLSQLRCAQSDSPGSYLDVPVAEKALKQRLVSPCFIALSRRSTADPFSRVNVSQSTWSLGGYSEYRRLLLEPKEAFSGRCLFSVNALFEFAYRGYDDESVVGDGSIVGGFDVEPRRKRTKGWRRPSVRHATTYNDPPSDQLLHSSQTRSDRPREPTVSGPAAVLIARRTGGSLKPPEVLDGERRQSMYTNMDSLWRRSDPNQRPRHSLGREWRPGEQRAPRRRSDNRIHGPGHGGFRAPAPVGVLSGISPQYAPPMHTGPAQFRQDAPFDIDRRASDPAAILAFMMQQQRLSTDPSRAAGQRQRAGSTGVETACRFPHCEWPFCNSQKGRSYARQLRLSGQAWHEYADKLARGGWNLSDTGAAQG